MYYHVECCCWIVRWCLYWVKQEPMNSTSLNCGSPLKIYCVFVTLVSSYNFPPSFPSDSHYYPWQKWPAYISPECIGSTVQITHDFFIFLQRMRHLKEKKKKRLKEPANSCLLCCTVELVQKRSFYLFLKYSDCEEKYQQRSGTKLWGWTFFFFSEEEGKRNIERKEKLIWRAYQTHQ